MPNSYFWQDAEDGCSLIYGIGYITKTNQPVMCPLYINTSIHFLLENSVLGKYSFLRISRFDTIPAFEFTRRSSCTICAPNKRSKAMIIMPNHLCLIQWFAVYFSYRPK